MRKRGRDRGASALELALVLPLLLLVLGGIIDFGRLFAAQITITQASREGARMKSLGFSNADMTTRVNAAANGLTVVATPNVTCSASPAPTDYAQVTVTTTFRYLVLDGVVNLFGGGWSATQTLSSSASMRCLG